MALRKAPKQKRSQEMVDSILKGASIVLAGEKYSFSTINISKQTGISVGSFYQYYKNKEEVLKDLINSYSSKQNDDILILIQKLAQQELTTDLYIENILSSFYEYIYQDLYLIHNLEKNAKEAKLYYLLEELDMKFIENLYHVIRVQLPHIKKIDINILVNLIKSLNNPLSNQKLTKKEYIYYSKKIVNAIIG